MHLLIVNTYHLYLKMIGEYLQHHLPEATLTLVETAEEALAAYDAGGVDLVVTAHHLPKLSGVSLVRILHTRTPRLPIIMYTGDETAQHQALEAGARAFILKGGTDSLVELVTTIRQVLPPTE